MQSADNKINIFCQNLYFQYESKRPILKDVSFELLSGETLAIVGPTGSGKSTITKLLMRFYEYDSGNVLINQQDIRSLKQDSIFKHLGVVSQDISLFNESLRDNLIYGNSFVSDDTLNEVIRLTMLDSLVNSLPDGLDTIVGERGLVLSTGEKQKVGIARVLLKQSSFYIFDEATSAFDIETEKKIMQNIRTKVKGATVMIIAHRLSTIRFADNILVFDQGKIVESGTHESLMQRGESYARLYTTQMANH